MPEEFYGQNEGISRDLWPGNGSVFSLSHEHAMYRVDQLD